MAKSKKNQSSSTDSVTTNKEYFDFIKTHLKSIMDYSISGTKAFNQCDLLLYPEEGGLFIVEGSRTQTEWKDISIKDIQSDIIKALNRGDVSGFNELISKVSIKALKQPIECTCKTLLHNAAEQGNVTIAKRLIELGVPVDITVTKFSMTPLHAAIIWDQKEMETFLISQGASLESRFKNHTAKGLQKLKNSLNNRKRVNAIFDTEKLQEMLDEASHYHFKTRTVALVRRRLADLKSSKTIREQAKSQWTVKQSKKVQVYQEELEQAISTYERDSLLEKVKHEQEIKLNRKLKGYHTKNSTFEAKKLSHGNLQAQARKKAEKVRAERKKLKPSEREDPLQWLREKGGLLKCQVARN